MNDLYLNLMEKILVNTIYQDPPKDPTNATMFHWSHRLKGKDWPSVAHTMIGAARIHQLREACETVLKEGIVGDFIETGVWRGGACIMMKAVLKAYGDTRNVWCADSYEGLPPPTLPEDAWSRLHEREELSVSLTDVKRNFEKYELLDEHCIFLKGFFKDTLPTIPEKPFTILRLDGDLYESTMQALDNLYHKVVPGGFVIIDDYGSIKSCKAAVDEFRAKWAITTPIIPIDLDGVFWRK